MDSDILIFVQNEIIPSDKHHLMHTHSQLSECHIKTIPLHKVFKPNGTVCKTNEAIMILKSLFDTGRTLYYGLPINYSTQLSLNYGNTYINTQED